MYSSVAARFPSLISSRAFKSMILIGLLACCSLGCDSKKASTGNFKAALQKHFDENPVCVNPSYSGYPEQIEIGPNGKPRDTDYEAKQAEALKDAGLLTVKAAITTATDPYATMMHQPQRQIPILVYSLAQGHEEAWKTAGPNDKDPKLCYAKVHVKSVDNFTEPGDMLGHRISEADYTYELTDVASWAQRPALQEAFPMLKRQLDAREGRSKAMLELTNNGWQTDSSTRI